MKKKTTKKAAAPKKSVKKTLVVADEGARFWVNNGPVLKDLKELADALEKISAEQFNYHVAKDRNDFASWVNDILKDPACAKALRAAKTRPGARKVVIKYLAVYK